MYFGREEEAKLYRMLMWKEALALIGPRRAGKTTLALRLLEAWREDGGVGEYIDLEALKAPKTSDELSQMIAKVPEKGLVVLDEVQELDGWIKVVREEVEQNRRHVLITGSSASLLSKEIASSLGGRAIPETILTLSFRDAKKWGLTGVEEYLSIGGYPECVLRPNDAPKLHKLYLELTILRDVAARKGIRDIKSLTDLSTILLSEPGKTISAKRTCQMLKISQPTFRSFIDGLNDAFLILSVPPYLRSPRERIISDAKHYAYDTGLGKSASVSTQDDVGRRMENVVAIELIRRGYSISYLKHDKGECDFIAQKTGEVPLAIQVWSGDGEVPEREWDGLVIGMKTAKATGLLLSLKKVKAGIENIEVKTIEDFLGKS